VTAQPLRGGHHRIWESAVNTGATTVQMLMYFSASASAESLANFAKIIGQGFTYTPITAIEDQTPP